MATTLTLDRVGRVLLPKPIRDQLQLGPGDSLEVEILKGHIVLRPARGHGRMRKKHGVWVFHSGTPLTADVVRKTIRQVRAERDRRNLGKLR